MSTDGRHNAPHPSSYQQHPTQSSVINPPTGFAWNSSGSFGHSAQSPHYASTQARPDDLSGEPNKKKRSKGKEKDKDKSKSKSKHHSLSEHQAPSPDAHMPQGSSGSHSFRAQRFSHQPSPSGSNFVPLQEYPPPRDDYYRRESDRQDYDRQRHPRPLQDIYSHGGPPPGNISAGYRSRPPAEYNFPPTPTPRAEPRHREAPAHSNLHSQTTPQQVQSPIPSVLREPQPSDSGCMTPTLKQRPARLLTLLIDDMRLPESQLAEVRVPLKERPDGQIWVDALDITEALQSGPSKIDGPAKVSTMRGEFKQIFFRVSATGEVNCKSANVQVTNQKTVKVIVEDPDRHLVMQQHHQAYLPNGLLTPATDSMAVSPGTLPAPRPVSPYPADRYDRKQYDAQPDGHRQSSSRKRRRSTSPDARYRQIPGAYPDPSQKHYDGRAPAVADRPSGPSGQRQTHSQPAKPSEPTQRAPSSSSSSESGSSSDASSGSEASPTAQPHPLSQISPLPQTSSLAQMPPPPVTNLMPAPNSAHRLSRTVSSSDQRPPMKKQKHAHDSNAPLGSPKPRIQPNPSPIASSSPSATNASTLQTGGDTPAPQAQNGTSSAPVTVSESSTPDSQPESSQTTSQNQNQAPAPKPAAPLPTTVDDTVVTYLRGLLKAEAGFSAFVEARNKNLPVSQWMKHLQYAQTKFDEFVGKTIPEDANHGAGYAITKMHVSRALHQSSPTWGDECTEVVSLSRLYGPEGQRCVDLDVVDLYNEPEGVTTTLQIRRYLTLLKGVHSKWVAQHPEQEESK